MMDSGDDNAEDEAIIIGIDNASIFQNISFLIFSKTHKKS